jgi:hypothetical protein
LLDDIRIALKGHRDKEDTESLQLLTGLGQNFDLLASFSTHSIMLNGSKDALMFSQKANS